MSKEPIEETRDRLLCTIAASLSLVLSKQILGTIDYKSNEEKQALKDWGETSTKLNEALVADATRLANHYVD